MEEQEKYIKALIKLHNNLERLGPGDSSFSDHIIKQLPELPPNPRIADIGCGAGAGALTLAKKYHSKVKAVDFSKEFLDQMMHQASQEGLEDLIEPIECDMSNLGWESESIDLLWSEGAAYNITFEGALKAWRPLMADNGIAVISELSYFTSEVPEPVRDYWQNAYPAIGSESENSNHASSSGFEILKIKRLPSKAWWNNYYDPLCENIKTLKDANDEVMRSVIHEAEEEMKLFEEHEKHYGYSFYIMKSMKGEKG